MVLQEFVLSIGAALLFVSLVIWVSKAQIRWAEKSVLKMKSLPGPINFPFIGSIIQVGIAAGQGTLSQQYHNVCKRYGPVMSAKVGSLRLALVEDYDTAREIMCSPDWTAHFPVEDHYHEHTFGKNLGILLSQGEIWKETRRFVIRALGEFGFGELSTSERYIQEELSFFLEHFEQLRLKSNGALRMNGIFKVPMINIVWRMIMGVRLEYGDPETQKVIHLVEQASEIVFGLHPFFAFPWIGRIPGLNPLIPFYSAYKEILVYMKKQLDERRSQTGKASTQYQTSLMDRLIQKVDEEKNNPGTFYTDEHLLCVVADLLCVSVDTTTNSFGFVFLYLINYPDVQKKVHEELDRIVGRNRLPDVYDRSSMPYSEATMLETLRLGNVLPIEGRASTCDTIVNGCFVPKNTYCNLNLTQIHLDESIWGDPKVFRPERFLDENNRVIKENKLLAFGAGKRVCLGLAMAKVTWLAFFAAMFHKYEFNVCKEHPEVSMDLISGFTNSARTFYSDVKLR